MNKLLLILSTIFLAACSFSKPQASSKSTSITQANPTIPKEAQIKEIVLTGSLEELTDLLKKEKSAYLNSLKIDNKDLFEIAMQRGSETIIKSLLENDIGLFKEDSIRSTGQSDIDALVQVRISVLEKIITENLQKKDYVSLLNLKLDAAVSCTAMKDLLSDILISSSDNMTIGNASTFLKKSNCELSTSSKKISGDYSKIFISTYRKSLKDIDLLKFYITDMNLKNLSIIIQNEDVIVPLDPLRALDIFCTRQKNDSCADELSSLYRKNYDKISSNSSLATRNCIYPGDDPANPDTSDTIELLDDDVDELLTDDQPAHAEFKMFGENQCYKLKAIEDNEKRGFTYDHEEPSN